MIVLDAKECSSFGGFGCEVSSVQRRFSSRSINNLVDGMDCYQQLAMQLGLC